MAFERRDRAPLVIPGRWQFGSRRATTGFHYVTGQISSGNGFFSTILWMGWSDETLDQRITISEILPQQALITVPDHGWLLIEQSAVDLSISGIAKVLQVRDNNHFEVQVLGDYITARIMGLPPYPTQMLPKYPLAYLVGLQQQADTDDVIQARVRQAYKERLNDTIGTAIMDEL